MAKYLFGILVVKNAYLNFQLYKIVLSLFKNYKGEVIQSVMCFVSEIDFLSLVSDKTYYQ